MIERKYNMKAGAKSLRFLGEGKKLSVPFFQRRYVWEESNWQELLESFQNSEIIPFLGSIILKEDSIKESVIVDGQQRLTTITILAKAIYDCLSDEGKQAGSGIQNCVENFLYYRNNAADNFSDSFVRIGHSRIDHEDYNRVIESQMLHNVSEIDLGTINESSGNVLKCYKYYCKKLDHIGDSGLKALFNSIFDEGRKVFVLIELERGDINEQTIFDTINRAGIRLSTADIIKNNLFKRLLEKCGTDKDRKKKALDAYQKNWEDVFNPDQHVSELWDEERVFGNVKHNNLEFMLYCIACIKWGENGDMFSKLESVFERETAQLGFPELLMLVNEIKDYAQIFKKYILDFNELLGDDERNIYFKYEDRVMKLLLILQKFGIQMFYPYVIMRLKQVNQDENNDSLKIDFRILESFIMRRKISAKGTHDYTSKCYKIIKNDIRALVEDEIANPDAGISDIDIMQYLSNTKDDTAKMILFLIELYRRRLPSFDIDALEYKYTLEHIMPKRWEASWHTVPIVEDGNVIGTDTDEGKAFRNNSIQSIGNKTLLTSSLNSTVRNSAFNVKVNGMGNNKPGYKSHTSLLLTKELVDQTAYDTNWDEAHISARMHKLYEEFIEIWPSFKEMLPPPAERENSVNSEHTQYTDEQLADPLKLLEAMNVKDSINEMDNMYGMVSVAEFIRRIDVQSETIEKYISEGTIIPDLIVPTTQYRSTKYFKEETVIALAQQYGWTLITDKNRKQVFINMVNQMTMTYSYKPVLLKALFKLADTSGAASLINITMYFMNYYENRRAKKLNVEKSDSVFSKADCTFEEAEHIIKIYPLKRFSDMGVMSYTNESEAISFNNSIWSHLSDAEIKSIIEICDNKLLEYYKKL